MFEKDIAVGGMDLKVLIIASTNSFLFLILDLFMAQ
tara:strand:+ start:179 stop:286 length:108 start_codon:yes stop_codon:yes gene_type:complete